MPYLRSTIFQVLKYLVLSLLLFAVAPARAQSVAFSWPRCEVHHYGQAQDITPARIERELEDHLGLDVNLVLDTAIESQVGVHYTYHLDFQGSPVYGFPVKVNRFNNGRSTVIMPAEPSKIDAPARLSWDGDALNEWLDRQRIRKAHDRVIKTCFPVNTELNTGWIVHHSEGYDYWESLVDQNAQTVFRRPMVHRSGPDTLASALVFAPDPITSAETIYGGQYVDLNDSNLTVLNQWLREVQIPVRWDSVNGYWELRSDYCEILDLSNPFVQPPTPDTNAFLFGRGEAGFEAVNAYYHIHQMQEYLQSIGFFNLVNYPLRVDANGQGGADQSAFYEAQTPLYPRIEFGTGGVDDAEDADVIVHEYGHAISFSCAPYSNIGAQRQAIDEGFGDYLAVAYSLEYSDYRPYDVFNWDGHNTFWLGRQANVDRTYPSGLLDNIYGDGEMWASSLVEIHRELGRRVTDSLLINSMYEYVPNMTLPQAAHFFLQKDTLLFDAEHAETIHSVFCQRGFLPGCADTIGRNQLIEGPFLANAGNFATEGAPIVVYSNDYVVQYFELYALNGTLLDRQKATEGLRYYELTYPSLPNGIYLLSIGTTSGPVNYKLLRYSP